MKNPYSKFRVNSKPVRPPRELGEAGRELWKAIQNEYDVGDAGGQALLLSACRAEDDIVRMREKIALEGDVFKGDPSKPHPLLAAIRRAETTKRQSLRNLHLDIEPAKNSGPGRPSGR